MTECELPEFYEAIERTARKSHDCVECRTPIPPGEKYLRCVGKWSFGLESYAQHAACAEACMFIRDNLNSHECIAFGELETWWQDDGQFLDKKKEVVARFRKIYAKVLRRARA